MLAVLAAAQQAHRSDRPMWDGATALAALVVVLAAIGARRLLADRAVGWGWVAAGALASAACIWAGVPETGPVILVGGALAGSSAAAVLFGARWAPSAGPGAAAVLGWAALSGARGGTWATMGGALCCGVAPWFAVRGRLRAGRWRANAGPALLLAHFAVAALAARWIGVVPDAGWHRVGIVALAGFAAAGVLSRRA